MAENFCAKDRRVMPVCQLPPDGLTLGRLGKDYGLILDDLGKNYRAARGQLFSRGAGAVGQGKRHGEEELLDQAGGKFLRVDLSATPRPRQHHNDRNLHPRGDP